MDGNDQAMKKGIREQPYSYSCNNEERIGTPMKKNGDQEDAKIFIVLKEQKKKA